jgi:HEPN domain-containing protein
MLFKPYTMLTTINHLSKLQQDHLRQLIQKIGEAVKPEKIICYGSRVTIMQDWGCFLEDNGYYESIHPTFDLLIITRHDETRTDYEIIELVEVLCKPPVSVTCIAHKLPSVNEALEGGNPFFCRVHDKGILVYDNSASQLNRPAESFSGFLTKGKAEGYWNRWHGLAQHFLSLAAQCVSSGWSNEAVFLLHQAVEHTCIALIRVFTGYRSNTHNLSRLLALTENFSMVPVTIFPRITKEETALFNLLLRGYSEPRYKDVYELTNETVTILLTRVKELQSIAESLYADRIEFYLKNEGITFPLACAGV